MVDTWAKNLASASRRMSAAVFFTIVVRTVASSRTPDTLIPKKVFSWMPRFFF